MMLATIIAVGVVAILVALTEVVRYAVGRALRLPIGRRWPVRFGGGTRWARFVAMISGSVALYLAIVVGAFAIYRVRGVASGEPHYVVRSTKAGFDADGKLAVGDRILAIDGTPLGHRSLSDEVNARGGAPVTLTVHRDHSVRDITIRPTQSSGHWILGIVPALEPDRTYSSSAAINGAIGYPVRIVQQLAAQKLEPLFAADADPGGPKRIFDEYQRTEEALWLVLILFYASILLVPVVAADIVRAMRAGNDRDSNVA